MHSPNLAILALLAALLSASSSVHAIPQQPAPSSSAAPPTSTRPAPAPGATAGPGAGTGGQLDPAMIACGAAAMALSADKCFGQLITDSMLLATADNLDKYYDGITTVVRNMCGDTCNATFRNSSATLVDGCAGMLSSESLKSANMSIAPGTEGSVKVLLKDTMYFAKDLMCVKDTKAPAGDGQLCSVQSIQLSKKYKLISPTDFTIMPIDNPAATSPKTPAADPMANMLPGVANGASSLSQIMMPNATAWKQVPKAEACTPCMAMQTSQMAIYAKKKLLPIMQTMAKSEADEFGKQLDQMIKDVNGMCGDGFVKADGELVLGTANPQTTVVAQGSTASGAAPASALLGQAVAMVAAALVAVAMVFGASV
ncbi:hypothetical protein BCR44DRAFT_43668 [Catenaria anguillulae PL171]|uniref:Secreted protein n=1 Tax=Catenaria anguillulae PL171 TaxID=765915 RepID=A0A1Y2HI42_9FUNG|nr:hypothetical protein BCR44DRAFT_43668 [Catenaria anguillulae PL171]